MHAEAWKGQGTFDSATIPFKAVLQLSVITHCWHFTRKGIRSQPQEHTDLTSKGTTLESSRPHLWAGGADVLEILPTRRHEPSDHAPLRGSIHCNGKALPARTPCTARPVDKGLRVIGQLIVDDLARRRWGVINQNTELEFVAQTEPEMETTT